MKNLIITLLKVRFNDVNEHVLNRIAEKLAKNAMTNEQVQPAVDAVTFQQIIDNEVDHALNEAANENWIDSQVVLQTLGISQRTLQTLRKNRTLPYSKVGGKIFYKQSDIYRILRTNYIMFNLRNKN